MADHLVYDYHGQNIVGQSISTLYKEAGVEALEKIIDFHFLGYEWALVASWNNETSQTNEFQQSYLSQLRIKSSEEVATEWGFKAAYKGLEFSLGSSTKQFQEEETTESKGHTVTVKVGPNSSVFFYQKRYKFRTQVWFRLDAWTKLWTVGKWQADGVAALDGNVEIDGNEYLTTSSALSGRGNIDVEAKSEIVKYSNVKRFEDCTRRCQDFLHARGV